MKRIRLLWLLASVLAVLLATAGITYTWFTRNASLATLLDIHPPDSITIVPISADGSAMTELDLDFRENSDDYKDEDGTIHIVRPIRIESTSPVHQLEVVHTTNLSNLTFKIYPAKKEADGSISKTQDTEISGSYRNNQDANPNLAKEQILENYKSTDDVADIHAYPLYWLAVKSAIQGKKQEGWQLVESDTQLGLDPATKTEKIFYHTYYFLEISWKETTKETDLFYIMAQNIDVGN